MSAPPQSLIKNMGAKTLPPVDLILGAGMYKISRYLLLLITRYGRFMHQRSTSRSARHHRHQQ
ncbi:hypothetical protein K450DRAFT_221079 [Umbelopsis ramanniana AG]|uniref:Uncharacterized protein n=1 Tax=Umbelopsis ramanniana AG TaxID=1314678 RepID=A0AAD5HGX0_UMBRA|nr:uncharacterized protein K450DRAFT_221079 [Umbelopsis ramanniana AG]KAI8584012.1 hypothetical protein K450DRAFT_221079 [Umbelopsis ramanniana AG]